MLNGIQKNFTREDAGLVSMLMNFNTDVSSVMNFSDVLSQLQMYQDNLMKISKDSSSSSTSESEYNNRINDFISNDSAFTNIQSVSKDDSDENHKVSKSDAPKNESETKESEESDNLNHSLNSVSDDTADNNTVKLSDEQVKLLINKLSALLDDDEIKESLKEVSSKEDLVKLLSELDDKDKVKLFDFVKNLNNESLDDDDTKLLLAKLSTLMNKSSESEDTEKKVADDITLSKSENSVKKEEEVEIVVEDKRTQKNDSNQKVISENQKKDTSSEELNSLKEKVSTDTETETKSSVDDESKTVSKSFSDNVEESDEEVKLVSDDENQKKSVNDLQNKPDVSDAPDKNSVVEQTKVYNEEAIENEIANKSEDIIEQSNVQDNSSHKPGVEVISGTNNSESVSNTNSNVESNAVKSNVAQAEAVIKSENTSAHNNSANNENSANSNSQNGQLFNDLSKGENSNSVFEKQSDHLNHLFKENLDNLKKMTAFQELVKSAKMLVGDKITEMQMKLSPKELGNIDIQISLDEKGNLNARILTANTEVQSLIENNINELKLNFVEQGLNVQGFEVSVNQNKSERDAQNFSNRGNSKSKPGMKTGEVAENGIRKTAERLYEKYWEGKSTISLIA